MLRHGLSAWRLIISTLLLTTSWTPVLAGTLPASALMQRRQDVPFAVTGVQGTGVQQRLEVRDLAANADMYNIFILGLQKMQAMDQNNFLSYFQIAGIHGRPMVDWNAVPGNQSSSSPGYCTHVSNLFLTWHRPYLALYEQILVANAQDAARSWPAGPDRDRYLAAANNLRLPYWDWAKKPANGQNTMPSQLTDPTVTVQTPQGSQQVPNPLYSYRFHPTDRGLFYQIYIQWKQTLRWPTSLNSDANSQTAQVIQAVESNRQQWQQRVYNLLTQYTNFMDFTNEPFIKSAGPLQYDSLESLHDSLHSTIGGPNYGHMDVIDVSAFDPLFWLHHCMVDRIFALWQSVYPDSYVQPQAQSQSSYWYNAGTVLGQDAALVPFYSTGKGDFWTSDSVRDHKKFSYTYPELVSGNVNDVKSAINSLYGSTAARKRAEAPGTYGNSSTNETESEVTTDYLTNIRAPKNALGGSYNIHIFIGQPSDDPTQWPLDPHLVGTYGVVSMLDADLMNPILVGGTIPLTKKLEDLRSAGLIADLQRSTVEPFLKQELQWRVRNANGTEIDPNNVPGLAVSVVSTQVQPPTSNSDFPKWVTAPVVHSAITVDKDGGVNSTAEV